MKLLSKNKIKKMGCATSNSLRTGTISLSINETNPFWYIWNEYKKMYSDVFAPYLHKENTHLITQNGKSMEYDFLVTGEEPLDGYSLYICLHDGEVGASIFNANEFKKIKTYFSKSISSGISIAIKGINDSSNMFYVDECFVIYERIIRQTLAIYKVNPNKVYLLGLGLGGDAVYQIATRIPDRFAGIYINSGHSFGICLKNLINLPVVIQVGENYHNFDRNKNAIKVYENLSEIKREFLTGSNDNDTDSRNETSDATTNLENFSNVTCYVHADKDRQIIDRGPKAESQPIINDPVAWLNGKKYSVSMKNTDAIFLLSKYNREPYPKKIIWDLTKLIKNNVVEFSNSGKAMPFVKKRKGAKVNTVPITAERNSGRNEGKEKNINIGRNLMSFGVSTLQMETTLSHISGTSSTNSHGGNHQKNFTFSFGNRFYWLDLGNKTMDDVGACEVIASFNKETNTVEVSTVKFIRVLLNEKMVDFNKEITFKIGGNFSKKITVSRNFMTERRTLFERGDYTYIFSACVIIEYEQEGEYKVEQYEEIV